MKCIHYCSDAKTELYDETKNMKFTIRFLSAFLSLICCTMLIAAPAYQTKITTDPSLPTDVVPKEIQGVTIEERLGEKLDLNMSFTDQDGKPIKLGDLLKDEKPLLLSLNYYRCKTLCGVQLENLAKTIKDLKWPIGKDFHMATISFDKTDTPELAKSKQTEYLEKVGDLDGKWNFLIGSQLNIDKITKSIGFYYNYIPDKNEFAHTAAIFIISPDGTISRYLYGIDYKVKDVKFALMDAANGKIGSTTDRFLLFCCNYDPSLGRYTGLAIGLMRVAGIVTILFLLSIMFFYSRQRNKKNDKKKK